MSQSNVKELIPLLDDNNEMRRTVTGNYLFILKPDGVIISIEPVHIVDADKDLSSDTSLENSFSLIDEEVHTLDQEWREHALLDYEKLGLDSDQIAEKYWVKVFNLKNKLGATLFPNLKIVMRLLLALPFSNASVERVFSALKICKTDLRNRMDTSTIVNSLVIRESIEKDGGCKAFNPSMKMINTATWPKKSEDST
ncbi:hypothetical protein KQX54_014353 [Cotesia glomerata]|uniref:HAT C-terminal dimerisation domain-containing protein n=1 Tax=Cotesia glomerata TaxID=32391 RepID=A0AAV7I1B9_COTGL|nr:hypothetical protein KQX54_014353 [Cotesia glomerata]